MNRPSTSIMRVIAGAFFALTAFVLSAEARLAEPGSGPVRYTLISSARLSAVHSVLRQSLRQLLPGAEETYLDHKSPAAKKLIKELEIKFIPYVVFDDTVALHDSFFHMVKNNMIEKKEGRYVIPEQMLQMAEVLWLERRRIPKRLDVFVTSHCSACKQAEAQLIDFIRRNKADVELRLRYKANVDRFGVSSRFGTEGLTEDLRQITIQKYYPDKFWDYLLLLQHQRPEAALQRLGISPEEIEAKEDEALEILKSDSQQAKAFNVKFTPAFLWENTFLIPSLKGLKRHRAFEQLE